MSKLFVFGEPWLELGGCVLLWLLFAVGHAPASEEFGVEEEYLVCWLLCNNVVGGANSFQKDSRMSRVVSNDLGPLKHGTLEGHTGGSIAVSAEDAGPRGKSYI